MLHRDADTEERRLIEPHTRRPCQEEDVHFERDASGRLRKLGEGAFGQVQAQHLGWQRSCCNVMVLRCSRLGPCAGALSCVQSGPLFAR